MNNAPNMITCPLNIHIICIHVDSGIITFFWIVNIINAKASKQCNKFLSQAQLAIKISSLHLLLLFHLSCFLSFHGALFISLTMSIYWSFADFKIDMVLNYIIFFVPLPIMQLKTNSCC